MHYGYMLRSLSDPDKLYFGSTADSKARFSVHHAGGNVSTKPFRPWELAWYGGFPNKQTAIEFEKYLKSASGKAFAKKRLIPSPFSSFHPCTQGHGFERAFHLERNGEKSRSAHWHSQR